MQTDTQNIDTMQTDKQDVDTTQPDLQMDTDATQPPPPVSSTLSALSHPNVAAQDDCSTQVYTADEPGSLVILTRHIYKYTQKTAPKAQEDKSDPDGDKTMQTLKAQEDKPDPDGDKTMQIARVPSPGDVVLRRPSMSSMIDLDVLTAAVKTQMESSQQMWLQSQQTQKTLQQATLLVDSLVRTQHKTSSKVITLYCVRVTGRRDVP